MISKKLIATSGLFFLLLGVGACSETPEPETPDGALATATANASATPPTASATATATATPKLVLSLLEVRAWLPMEDGSSDLVQLRNEAQLPVDRKEGLTLYVFPPLNRETSGKLSVSGPFKKAFRGGDLVLMFDSASARDGRQNVMVTLHRETDPKEVNFRLEVDVLPPPKKDAGS